jgi:hypothetical protein
MEKLMERNPKIQMLTFALVAATLAPALSIAASGTRLIPPPPPRHQGDSIDGIQQESTWGVSPGQDRFSALRDDEGQEIDFNRGTLSVKPAREANRAPAGLEVKPSKNAAPAEADSGWKSAPKDDDRVVTKEATTSEGKRPVLQRVTKSEAARQEAETEKFVTEVQDPIARRKGVQEVSIIAGDLGFFPKTIFVSRDVPVRMFVTGASKGSLCIMMDSFNVRKQVRTNKIEEITFVPSQPGTYRFYCPVNGSEGTMVVKELTTDAPANGG